MDEHVRLAWKWFLDKYGIVVDADIEVKGDMGSIKIRSGSNDFEISFPLLDHEGSVISIGGFNVHTWFMGKLLEDDINSNGVIFAHVNDKKIPCGFIKDRKLILAFDPFTFIYSVLSGGLEGRTYPVGVPFLDRLSEILFGAIKHLIVGNGGILIAKSFWPNDKMFAVCLTHDVDEIKKTYQYVTRSVRFLSRLNFNGLKNEILSIIYKLRGKEPYWTFEEVIRLEKELGVRSSFYFLKETGKVEIFSGRTWRYLGRRYDFKDVSEIIGYLHSNGWDVGLHGSFHSYMRYDLLKREKEELEYVLGDRVVGIRQHNLNLKIPETWKIHESLGFEYDTTLGSNRYVGFRWGTCFPFYPIDYERNVRMKILEIPLIVEDIVLFRYSNPWNTLIDVINKVENVSGVLTMLWHHTVFNNLEYPGWANVYRRAIEYCKSRGAWVTSGREIAKWWKIRGASKVSYKIRNDKVEISSEIPVIVYSSAVRLIDGDNVRICIER